MKIPTIQGIIDRRILVNYIADPMVISKIIPAPFKPKLYQGKAVVGICLIRLKKIRPKWVPAFVGISSENGAHRIAVEWQENDKVMEGVYIPRRDTSLRLNHWVGGRIFPGKHFLAKFEVKESGIDYHVAFTSSDGTRIKIDATETEQMNDNSIFGSLENVSAFFEKGAIGYSPNKNKYEGLQLKTHEWKVRPLKVHHVQSDFFENRSIFPEGSIQFDNALLMTKIKHEWVSVTNKNCI